MGQLSNKGKCKSISLLHRFIDYLEKDEFYGQTVISWEKGQPVIVKNNTTLTLTEIEKILIDN